MLFSSSILFLFEGCSSTQFNLSFTHFISSSLCCKFTNKAIICISYPLAFVNVFFNGVWGLLFFFCFCFLVVYKVIILMSSSTMLRVSCFIIIILDV